jgi:hypothetical protein
MGGGGSIIFQSTIVKLGNSVRRDKKSLPDVSSHNQNGPLPKWTITKTDY